MSSRDVAVRHARSNALDVYVERGGQIFGVLDVGIGHPPHTITTDDDGPRGRCATDAEVALAEALALYEGYREAIGWALDHMAHATDMELGPGGVAREVYGRFHTIFHLPGAFPASDEKLQRGER